MSTPNFSYHNKLYVIPVDDDSDNEMEVEWIKESIKGDIDAAFKSRGFIVSGLYKEYDNERSYPGTKFLDVSHERWDGKGTVRTKMTLAVRAGYYSGGNIDYTISDPEYVDNYDDVPNYKWIDDIKNKLFNKVEKILKKNCKPAICLGIFSNGEAVYRFV